jgi:HD superfamily phosphohydrolase
MAEKRKIINDPVYGFITVSHPLIFDIISHPYYQRLRRIHQMALAQLVYPGATHTRLHHSLGAYHLMCLAVSELKNKNIEITDEEELAVQAAILLHDIGHGPFSHALENILLPNIHHEALSLAIMQQMNNGFGGALDTAIKIFTNNYHKPFLHQLISGQLDVDRMDYLTRDSFYTGVSEGVIGYARILKMLAVHNDQLVVEEKGIYSVEKFLVARRQMYWQVYLHKTVLAAEKMLVKIMERVREIYDPKDEKLITHSPLDYFFNSSNATINDESLLQFSKMDDVDLMFAIKRWSLHPDRVLSILCNGILKRNLYKCLIRSEEFDENLIAEKRKILMKENGFDENEVRYFIFSGTTSNTMYQSVDERINIIFKDGSVKDIAEIDNALIHQTISSPVKKFYICQLNKF